MRLATLLLLLGLAAPLAAQPAPGDCPLGTAQADLAISDVRARMFNAGNLFFGATSEAQYVVPRFTERSPIFAAGVWIAGRVNGQLRAAGSTYTNFEFWPGPLDPGGALPDSDCRRLNANGREAWDRIYTVSVFDVEAYDDTGTATPDLEDWPVGLGAPAVDANGDPVVPTSRDQLIDLGAGERPVIYGGQTAFWVMNDVGNEHPRTQTPPIGVEVRVSAFAIPDPDDPTFDRGTFYRYEVVNRYTQPLEDAYFTLFTDPDLGDYEDDYVGSDSTRSLMYVYNADNFDGTPSGYGTPPPAIGFDLLSGAASAMYFIGAGPPGTSDPVNGPEMYNIMQGRWTNGLPLVACGMGINCSGPETKWAFHGDPTTGMGWSEVSANTSPGDRRAVVSSPRFTLAPDASRTFDLAIIFAVGDHHLDSVAELRAASDQVQAAYNSGALFETVDPGQLPPPPSVAPALVAPPDGATFTEGDVTFVWGSVDGATYYELQLDTEPDFPSPITRVSLGETVTLTPSDLPANHQDDFYWRVRAANSSGLGPFSAARTFTYYRYQPAWAGGGDGIVEVAYPGVPDVCSNAPDDPGCKSFGGNTVWHDPNATDDYYVGSGSAGQPGIDALERYIEAATPDDFEVRFTDEGSLAVYAFLTAPFPIARVPFELWNVRDLDDPADDVRMIPFVNPNGDFLTDWEDQFTGTDPWEDSPCDGGCPITDWIYWMMPDRPNGYDLFEAAAIAFGGPGALYDPTADGDDQIDISPYHGAPCTIQGVYVDYCYRNDELSWFYLGAQFVYPIGRMVFADLTDDGTTPPTGTVVRLITTKAPAVANEPGGTGLPETYALGAVYPNPLRARATVAYALPAAGRVRVAVYDVLGREVAILAEGLRPAGHHEATLDGAALASGVYVVVLTGSDGAHATRKVTVLR